MARVQLNEQDVKEVVGGAFNFFENANTGEPMCYVDGVGMYYVTSSDSKKNIIKMCAQNDGLSQQELADMAVANGWITPY